MTNIVFNLSHISATLHLKSFLKYLGGHILKIKKVTVTGSGVLGSQIAFQTAY